MPYHIVQMYPRSREPFNILRSLADILDGWILFSKPYFSEYLASIDQCREDVFRVVVELRERVERENWGIPAYEHNKGQLETPKRLSFDVKCFTSHNAVSHPLAELSGAREKHRVLDIFLVSHPLIGPKARESDVTFCATLHLLD